MEDTDKPDSDDDIRRLLEVSRTDSSKRGLTDRVVRRARANVGQRDTLLFAIVKIWRVIAELLAPVFAQLAERRARVAAGRSPIDPDSKKND